MVRKKITTVNTEIYKQFSNLKLNSCSRVILKTAKVHQVKKIVKDINKNENIVNMEIFNNEIVIEKMLPVNFDVYLKRKINKII